MPTSHRDAHPYGRSAQDVRRREERSSRQRRLRMTQLIVFSALAVALIAAAVFAATRLMGPDDPAPAAPTGASDGGGPTLAAQGLVCPEPGATPAAPGEVSVSVLNGTSRSGLAGDVTGALAERGYQTGSPGNTSEAGPGVTVAYGPAGYRQAAAVAAQFEGAALQLDEREDASVTVMLGSGFEALSDPAIAQERLTQPVAVPEGCPAG